MTHPPGKPFPFARAREGAGLVSGDRAGNAARDVWERWRLPARPWQRWYKTARWRALRKRQLKAEPLCYMCADRGKVREATVCNHRERHKGDPVKFWQGPFDSLCADCHNTDQARIENGGKARQQVDSDGWPI